jgi:hypothetical protein
VSKLVQKSEFQLGAWLKLVYMVGEHCAMSKDMLADARSLFAELRYVLGVGEWVDIKYVNSGVSVDGMTLFVDAPT